MRSFLILFKLLIVSSFEVSVNLADKLNFKFEQSGSAVFLSPRLPASFLFRSLRSVPENKSINPTNVDTCVEKDAKFTPQIRDKLKQDSWYYLFELRDTYDATVCYIGAGIPTLLVFLENFDYTNDVRLWRSQDYGKNFEEIGQSIISARDPLLLYPTAFEHSKFKNYIIVIGVLQSDILKPVMLISEDLAQNFETLYLPFEIPLEKLGNSFTWHEEKVEKMLFISEDETLYYSSNSGRDWLMINLNVGAAEFFSTQQGDFIYYLEYVSPHDYLNSDSTFFLTKYDIRLQKKTTFKQPFHGFGINGKTMYASIGNSEGTSRSLHVSKDGGDHWFQANLEELVYDEFYSVLDIEDEIMVVHVGSNEGGSDRGTIYVSDSECSTFSLSLKNHAYIRYDKRSYSLTDFYVVKGMRGTLMSTVIEGESDIFSVISFNRGASWQKLRVQPNSDPCADCNFLIFNKVAPYFNTKNDFLGNPPLSRANTPGIVLANALQYKTKYDLESNKPDFYISRDGGYNWQLVRKGPHLYEILDQGGILVAVSLGSINVEPTDSISVSFDEGACWQDYKFSSEPVYVIDILAEAATTSPILSIWAQSRFNNSWIVHTLDFSGVVKECHATSDYFDWTPHSENGQNGCLLGLKETFKRLKTRSFCRNGGNFQGGKPVKTENCNCTEEDWECSFGFVRKPNSSQCAPTEDKRILETICDQGSHLQTVVMSPYRKVAGDVCENGVSHKDGIEKTYSSDTLCDDTVTGVDFIEEVNQPFSDHQQDNKPEKPQDKSHPFVTLLGILCILAAIGALFWFSRKKFRTSIISYNSLSDDSQALVCGQVYNSQSEEVLVVNSGPKATNKAKKNPTAKNYRLHVGSFESTDSPNLPTQPGVVFNQSDLRNEHAGSQGQNENVIQSDDDPILT